jgi:hypothetical protein
MRRVIMAALIAKLVGTLVRYAVLVSVYAEGDALEYDRVGAGLAQFFRSGDFSVDLGQRIIGTGFIEGPWCATVGGRRRAFALGAVQDFFRLDEERSIEEVLNQTQERTSKGGSEFATPGARSPVQLPLAIFSVIFRPLPYEAGNLQAFVASLEGVFLLVLFLRRWRRLGNLVPRRRTPYLAFVTTYSLLFTFAFSNVSNFGILARQRTQLFPLLLVVLAVPYVRRTTASNRDPASIADRVPASQVRIAARAGR